MRLPIPTAWNREGILTMEVAPEGQHGSAGWPIEVPGFMAQTEAGKRIHLAAVSPEYFDTLGITMLLGRGFTPATVSPPAS
jgi:hypothetical protein